MRLERDEYETAGRLRSFRISVLLCFTLPSPLLSLCLSLSLTHAHTINYYLLISCLGSDEPPKKKSLNNTSLKPTIELKINDCILFPIRSLTHPHTLSLRLFFFFLLLRSNH